MTINLKSQKPLPKRRPMIPLSSEEQRAIDEYLNEFLKKGWIRKVESDESCSIATSMFFVGKKDGGARMVTNYRDVNDITIDDPYPIPIMYELSNRL